MWCDIVVLAMHGDVRVVLHWSHFMHLSCLHAHVMELMLVCHLLLLPRLLRRQIGFIFFVHTRWTPMICRSIKRLLQKIWIR